MVPYKGVYMLFISANVDILTPSVSIPEVFKNTRNILVSYFNSLYVCVFLFLFLNLPCALSFARTPQVYGLQ